MFKQIFLFSVLTSSFVFGQENSAKPSKKTLKLQSEIHNLIKKRALYSDSLNWKKINIEVSQLLLTENDSESEKIIFDYYIKELKAAGDKHSFFVTKKYIEEKSQQAPAVIPEGKYLGDGTALLTIPRCSNYSGEKDIAYAEKVRSDIKKLDTENTVTGWIIDLRRNTGGNMWPMVGGLNALIEDGTAGYFVFGGSKKDSWRNKNGEMSGAKISDYKVKNQNVKIALLIDDYTASSGEMTAISFLGLPNVRTFGKDSAGYTTSNNTLPLSNGAIFNLATGAVADRTGKVYTDKIKPNVYIENKADTPEDEVIETAKKWLNQL